jgi:protocatechuate 3,4-dioxygenase beta subunit
MDDKSLSRRDALRLSAGLAPALVLGCRSVAFAQPSPQVACVETHDQIEGPYYRAGAPERWNLVEPGIYGTILEMDGRVTGHTCNAGQRDIELDVWQANAEGRYDNDGSFGPPQRFMLRGRVHTDAGGRYHIRTVVPGRYLNGAQYRPAHIHVKLRGNGFRPLTTQLYFPNDPYNDVDPFLHRSLVMAVDRAPDRLKARFDFVLHET